MKKIPTIFQRDFAGGRPQFVTEEPHPDCAWVFAGEGRATLKLDGTSCMIKDGVLFKRREIKDIALAPAGFIAVETEALTDAVFGWAPVGDGAADKWHREGLANLPKYERKMGGTFELLGPKVQKNRYNLSEHHLAAHDGPATFISDDQQPPRTFEGLKQVLRPPLVHGPLSYVEGFVFHHRDGRMAKVKARDFGWKL